MKIAFFTDKLELGSAAQQLLDRFVIGYPRDGVFHSAPKGRVILVSETGGELIQKRIDEYGLLIGKDDAVADGYIVVYPGIVETLPSAKRGSCIFVYGAVSNEAIQAARVAGVSLLTGTVMATALQAPALKPKLRAREALVVVQGPTREAELAALDGLLPLLNKPTRIRRARYMEDEAVWQAGEKREWSWGLLRAALSRSDSPQGNAILDGRVEDMAGLGLLPSLAKNPRGWLLEHDDGLRTTILVLDGVVADTLVALKVGGRIVSTQLFRAPSPMREDYSRLAMVIEDFFTSGKLPWGLERSRIVGSAVRHFERAESRTGQWIDLA